MQSLRSICVILFSVAMLWCLPSSRSKQPICFFFSPWKNVQNNDINYQNNTSSVTAELHINEKISQEKIAKSEEIIPLSWCGLSFTKKLFGKWHYFSSSSSSRVKITFQVRHEPSFHPPRVDYIPKLLTMFRNKYSFCIFFITFIAIRVKSEWVSARIASWHISMSLKSF